MLLRVVAIWYTLLRIWLVLGMLRRQKRSTEQPKVSVIVAPRNEGDVLPQLLEALRNQTYPRYETIVVDDRSTDHTSELLSRWQAQDSRLRSLAISDTSEQVSPKIYALAQGAKIARGDVLLFTDADCHVPPTWIEGMTAYFAPDIGAVLGYVELFAAHGTLLEQIQVFDYFAMMATLAGATKLGRPIGATGANMAYRRAAYEQAGGFEGLSAKVGEDMGLIQHVIERTPWRVAFCDDQHAFICSPAEATVARLVNQRARWMKGGNTVLLRNAPLLMVSMSIGVFNGILTFFPVLLSRDLRRALGEALALRLSADLFHFGLAAWRFKRMGLLRFFLPWLLVHIPATLFQPLLGLHRSLTWKEEKAKR